jgi:hypothetical protein
MNANELADDMEGGRFNDINYNKKKAADFVRQQQAEIEALRNQLWDLKSEPWGFDRHQAKEQTTMEVMSEHCTCYKLGYSQLNNYTKVENELLTKGEVK